MAYSVPLFSETQNEGVNVNVAYSAASTANLETPAGPLALGQVVVGTLNGEWVLCTASTATISKYDVVTIGTTFTASPATALPSFGLRAGIAMATATTGQYFWVMTNGVSPGVNSATAAANVQLYTGTAAGQIGVFSSAGFTRLLGIVLTTAVATAGNTNSGAVMINARTYTSV
jgi:hypothetical protein